MISVVATPIGNLEDLTLRALRVLKEADVIFCEDTRVSKKLLDHYEISGKKLISYHHHTNDKKIKGLIDIVKQNKVALITDAGTPGISDPGNMLIQEIVNQDSSIEIEAIPGPSAVVAALSVSGFPTDKFIFKGFIPHKKGREKFFKEIADAKETVVFYESPHRIEKTLNSLKEINGQLVVARELTKKFETIYRGRAGQILEDLQKDFPSGKLKGEFVLIVR